MELRYDNHYYLNMANIIILKDSLFVNVCDHKLYQMLFLKDLIGEKTKMSHFWHVTDLTMLLNRHLNKYSYVIREKQLLR